MKKLLAFILCVFAFSTAKSQIPVNGLVGVYRFAYVADGTQQENKIQGQVISSIMLFSFHFPYYNRYELNYSTSGSAGKLNFDGLHYVGMTNDGNFYIYAAPYSYNGNDWCWVSTDLSTMVIPSSSTKKYCVYTKNR